MPDPLDHKAEALRLLGEAEKRLLKGYDSPTIQHLEHEALVYSNLAIAEGQERVAEELRKLREEAVGAADEAAGARCRHLDMSQTGDGHLRCDRCGHVEPDPFYGKPGS